MEQNNLRWFKVVTLYLGGRGNKKFYSGDVVNEQQLVDGNVQKLIDDGSILPISPEDALFLKKGVKPKPSKKEKAQKAEATNDDADASNDEMNQDQTPTFTLDDGTPVYTSDDCKKSDITNELDARGIDYTKKDNKKVLFQLLQ